MPTLAELQQQYDKRGMVRKIQRAVGLLAPTSVTLPTSLYDTATPSTLKDFKADGWLPAGIVSPDGWTFSADITKDDIDALGYAGHVRSDITQVARTVQFTPFETLRRNMLELVYGVDLSAATQDATTGEFTFDEPDLPVDAEWRLLVIGDDGPAAENWILGKLHPRVKISDRGDEQWQKEGALQRQITLDIFTDEDAGTPVRHFFAGTGAVKYKDVLGFAA